MQRSLDSWTANAPAWTRAVREGRIESRRASTDEAIVAAALAWSPASVLDVGCGEGWLSRRLAAQGLSVTGFDGCAPLIDAARAAGGATYHVLDYAGFIADPQAVGGPHALAVANFAILDAEAGPLLGAIRSTLARNGVLLVQTVHPANVEDPEREGWRVETFRGFGAEGSDWTPMPWYYRTAGGWRRLLEESGFKVAAVAEPRHPATGRALSLLFTGLAG